MFYIDDILEKWAIIYEPMQHNPSAAAKPEDRAFFLIDRMELENAFTRVFNLLKRPCLCYAVNYDSVLDEQKPRFALNHDQLYICAKQKGSDPNYMQDERAARDAKRSLNEMTLDLIAFLYSLQDAIDGHSFAPDTPQPILDIFASLTDEDRRGIKGLRLAQTAWWSTPRYKNGWWIMGIELYGLDPRPLCNKPTHYLPAFPTFGDANPAAPAPRRGRKG